MTLLNRRTWSILSILYCLGSIGLPVATAKLNSPRLRAAASVQVQRSISPLNNGSMDVPQRRLEEALEVLYVDEDEKTDSENGEGLDISQKETTTREEESVAPPSSDTNTKKNKAHATKRDPDESTPKEQPETAPEMSSTATIAEEFETEDPILAQEESTSTLLLNIPLSLTAQRFLGIVAAIIAMIWTAHQMSENPDGLYASLCRSILTGIRVVCRIVTCKSCGGVHRHVPITSLDYAYRVNDPSMELQ